MAALGLFEGLVDDAAMFPPGDASVGEALSAHLDYRRSWFGSMVGPLVVSDQRLADVGRARRQAQAAAAQGAEAAWGPDAAGPDTAEGDLKVSVVNTTGAGGLLALAGRDVPGVEVVAVETALRDLDDLVGNAARVVSAAAELDEDIRVFVELPYSPGWQRAAELVEAAGQFGKIRTGGLDASDTPSPAQLAEQLSVLVETDLPFKATAGLHHALPTLGGDEGRLRQHGFLNVLAAVEALVEGASTADAAGLLAGEGSEAGGDRVLARVRGWSDSESERVRRRFRSFGCCGVLDPVGDLVALGLVQRPT